MEKKKEIVSVVRLRDVYAWADMVFGPFGPFVLT